MAKGFGGMGGMFREIQKQAQGVQKRMADLQEDLSRGYALVDQWRIEEADAYASSLLKQYGRSGDLYFLLGRVEFFKGNYKKGSNFIVLLPEVN